MNLKNPRQLAFLALRSIQRGAFADVALDRVLSDAELSSLDRRLLTELVYGSVRQQRCLDALIDQLGKKPAYRQPPDLRGILHLGLYQLRYLQIPAAAAVNSTVELAKQNRLAGLAGLVNGLLRQYIRLADSADPLHLPDDPVERLAVSYSYPDWIVAVWLEQLGFTGTAQLCAWLNQPPRIDLRVNPLQATVEKVEAVMQAAGVAVERVPPLPYALRLVGHAGPVPSLPGFHQGWWTVQDSSAQLVSYLLNPQPGDVVVDACAAPGGKTTHLAELLADQGQVWACDRNASRLRKLKENTERLRLDSIQTCMADSRDLPRFVDQADRVLLDAPCSGLGTLHRHADARWRQTPQTVQELSRLQAELLAHTATWVKPRGVLVYATCTLHPAENEAVIQQFLHQHPGWQISPPDCNSPAAAFTTPKGWVKVWPHKHSMDGFFMVRLARSPGGRLEAG